MLETILHFISAIGYRSNLSYSKIKKQNKEINTDTYDFYTDTCRLHTVGFYGLTLLVEGVFEPLPVAVLIFFGIVYSGLAKPKNME
jgi:hypothetical protein